MKQIKMSKLLEQDIWSIFSPSLFRVFFLNLAKFSNITRQLEKS